MNQHLSLASHLLTETYETTKDSTLLLSAAEHINAALLTLLAQTYPTIRSVPAQMAALHKDNPTLAAKATVLHKALQQPVNFSDHSLIFGEHTKLTKYMLKDCIQAFHGA